MAEVENVQNGEDTSSPEDNGAVSDEEAFAQEQQKQQQELLDIFSDESGEEQEDLPEASDNEPKDLETGEAEVPEEPEEPQDPDDTSALLEEIQELKNQVAELKSSNEGEEESDEENTSEETSSSEEDEYAPTEFIDTEQEFSSVLNDRESFNKLLNDLVETLRQDMLTNLPDVVQKTVERQTTQKEVIQSWREENKDLLEEHSDYTAYVANKLQSENPDKPIDELLEQTAERVRKDLKLSEEAKELEEERQEGDSVSSSSSPKTARKPRGGRGGAQSDTRNEQQKQIDSIIP